MDHLLRAIKIKEALARENGPLLPDRERLIHSFFCWLRRPSRPRFCSQASTGSDDVFDVVSISEASGWALLNQGAWTWPISSRHSAGIGRPSSSRRNQSTTACTSVPFP